MAGGYFGVVALAERLHRRTLELLEGELTRLGLDDISATQATILLHMGADEMTVSELTLRGCYQGTNVSYNLTKLVESGYVIQERSERDRRVVRVSASPKGRALAAHLERFYETIEAELSGTASDRGALANCEAVLGRLERFATARLSRPAVGLPALPPGPERPLAPKAPAEPRHLGSQVVWPTSAVHSRR